MRYLPRLTRRRFLGLLGGAAALGFYTWSVEPHWVEFVHRDMPIPGLPDVLHPAIDTTAHDISPAAGASLASWGDAPLLLSINRFERKIHGPAHQPYRGYDGRRPT